MTITAGLPVSPMKDFFTGALHMTPLNLAVVPWAILAGRRRLSFAYLFGAGLSFYLVWVLVSVLGIVLAHSISDLSQLKLDFSVVATLLAIVVPLIKLKSALTGAIISFALTIFLTRQGIQGGTVISGVSAMLIAVFLGRKWGDVK